MDQERFDRLARLLAEGGSRRKVLGRMIGGALGGAVALTGARTAGAAQDGKVNICHRTGSASNPYNYISVNANAVAAHAAHGDAINPDFLNDINNCGGCGIVCDDGLACTTNTCVGGVCVYTAVDCSGAGDQCNVGTCNPSDGSCYADPTPLNGAACDDRDACTENDVCLNGVCGGSAVDCSAYGDQCNAAACDSASGCYADPAPFNGASCDDENACTENDVCTNGTCGGTAVICPDDECNTGFCDEDNNGACGKIPANEGADCTATGGVDGTCVAGTCEPVCGSLSGTITSAADGSAIGGATVQVDGQSTITAADGSYSFACVASGEQMVYASADGYNNGSAPATIVAGSNTIVGISLLPEGVTDRITVVLNWNAEPLDLDSHMSGPDGSGGRFHVAWYAPNPVDHASLDVDDVDGLGPETVTVIKAVGGIFVAGEYRYWVHNYSQFPNFDVSGARVTFYQDGTQLATFLVADASGNQADDIWHVFNFTLSASGVITPSNGTPVQQLQPGDTLTVL